MEIELLSEYHTKAVFDQPYLESLLSAWDAHYDYEDDDWTPPEPPDLPDPTLWPRARAEIMRRAVLLVARTDRTPDWLSDAIIDYAFEVHDGH